MDLQTRAQARKNEGAFYQTPPLGGQAEPNSSDKSPKRATRSGFS